jgi:lipopolysaccharide transport system permease protein
LEILSPSRAAGLTQEVVIRPMRGWIPINWREMVDGRELLFFLAWRDVKIRYKQTVLGVAWALIQPLLTMVIFTIVFGRYAKMPYDGGAYAPFVFAGLIPWTFFSNGVSNSGQSLVMQQHLLTKIYFPRLFVPTATIGPFLVDMVISFGLYAFVLAAYGIVPSWRVVFLPPLIVLTLMVTLGFGYSLAALTVLYRDVRYTVPFMLQILMFVSPIIYPARMITQYRWVLALNPLCGIIEAYRACILGTDLDWGLLAASVVLTTALFVFGLYFFRKTERRFADIA